MAARFWVRRSIAAIIIAADIASKGGTLNELVSLVAHEVGQPLAAISLNAGTALRILEERGLDRDEDLTSAIVRIRADCLRAHRILSGLRDLMGGQVQLHAPFDLQDAIAGVQRVMAPALDAHGVTLCVELPAAPVMLCGPTVLIEQLLINLMRNAIEAMDQAATPKQIRIVVSPSAGAVDIRVIDSGPGVPQGQAEAVFTPFFTTKPDGGGLGLNICRVIALHHAGQLVLEPSNNGACFRVTLPLAPGNLARASVIAPPGEAVRSRL